MDPKLLMTESTYEKDMALYRLIYIMADLDIWDGTISDFWGDSYDDLDNFIQWASKLDYDEHT